MRLEPFLAFKFLVRPIIAGCAVVSLFCGSAESKDGRARAEAEASVLNVKGDHITHLTFDGRRRIGAFEARHDSMQGWIVVFGVNRDVGRSDAAALGAVCGAIHRAATKLESDTSPLRQGSARDLDIKLAKMIVEGLGTKIRDLTAVDGQSATSCRLPAPD